MIHSNSSFHSKCCRCQHLAFCHRSNGLESKWWCENLKFHFRNCVRNYHQRAINNYQSYKSEGEKMWQNFGIKFFATFCSDSSFLNNFTFLYCWVNIDNWQHGNVKTRNDFERPTSNFNELRLPIVCNWDINFMISRSLSLKTPATSSSSSLSTAATERVNHGRMEVKTK